MSLSVTNLHRLALTLPVPAPDLRGGHARASPSRVPSAPTHELFLLFSYPSRVTEAQRVPRGPR